MEVKFVIFARKADGSEFECFRWTRDAASEYTGKKYKRTEGEDTIKDLNDLERKRLNNLFLFCNATYNKPII